MRRHHPRCHIVLCSHSLRHHRGHPLNPLLQGVEPFPMSPVGGGPTVNSDSEQSDRGEDEDHLGSLEESVVGSSSMLMDSPSQSKEDELLLMAGDAPPPKEQLSIVKVKPGHELKLKCELNNTYGRIIWLLNGNGIRTDNGRYSIQGPNKNRAIEGRLTINNVLPEDNGVWQCHETKFDGKEHVSKPIRVIVLAAPRSVHLEFDGRRISPTPLMSASSPSSKVTYREKDNVTIQCVVEGGNPPPRVYWFLNSRNLTNHSQVKSEYLDDTKIYISRSILRMDNITRSENNKSVLCVVDHELLTTANDEPSYLRAMAQFNIEYHPSFVLSRIPGFGYPIREGIAMALKCEVDANPMSRPIWLKDKREPPVPQTDDGFLNFTSVHRNHTGWYQCESHHPLGKFSSVGIYVTVRYEPTIVHQPPKRIEATVGDRVQMVCGAEGTPSPALCWSRIGYGGSLTTVGSGQELILDRILYQEAGNYRCTAVNRVGLEERRAVTHDVTVVVSGRPTVYPTNRTIMGFTGQPLSLSVEMCANPMPTRSFWIFGNTALKPGARHRNKYVAQQLTKNDKTGDCYLAVLTILNVSSEDAGEYMFLVKNSKGVHEGTISLNITQASYSISISSHTESSRAYSPVNGPPVISSSLFPFPALLCGLSTWLMLSGTWVLY
ncbi:Immunoglobulin superfamily member 10 [Folsomia candida]|uniref:Immunoglobulin superfamily member 10 n=1 Tax=Folsomia candida TaxID=158441 RepID=A0A226EUY3_FOLCA|nr:Immunoglobulin superfamily member 10 [Folsomia candida]